MMKNKNKKQEDEGSTKSNASRYDSIYLTFLTLFWLFTFSSLVDHLWTHMTLFFTSFISMTLVVFNSHTLIFPAFLTVNTDLSGPCNVHCQSLWQELIFMACLFKCTITIVLFFATIYYMTLSSTSTCY